MKIIRGEKMIRQVQQSDLPTLIIIEEASFTPEEAATPKAFEERIASIPDSFLVYEENGEVVGLVNGPVVQVPYITDDLFTDIGVNSVSGGHQTVLGLAVAPKYRGKGIARKLLSELEMIAKKAKRETVTLTCRTELVSFYEKLGYDNHGQSDSTHGGVQWFNLVKKL